MEMNLRHNEEIIKNQEALAAKNIGLEELANANKKIQELATLLSKT